MVSSCRDDDGSFTNHVFNTTDKVNTIFITSDAIEDSRIIEMKIAQPVSYNVLVSYSADLTLVDKYNATYNDQATALDPSFFNIPVSTDTIIAGNVKSKGISVDFKNINKLNRDSIYVLPVTMTNANIDILNSAKITYYVFKGSSLINVVADIDENYLEIKKWNTPSAVDNLSQLTMEALIRVHNFDRMISTIMGIEDYFLIRLGDANFPSNQVQVATKRAGNFPDANSNFGLPTNKWVHIALTYDSETGAMILYVDGKVQATATKNIGVVDFAKTGDRGFYIGYSYEPTRYLAGEISECRIWNVVRTEEEIANNPYFVEPDTPGLAAYWKCNEGEGMTILDRTKNGNDIVANGPLKWTQVKLPE